MINVRNISKQEWCEQDPQQKIIEAQQSQWEEEEAMELDEAAEILKADVTRSGEGFCLSLFGLLHDTLWLC